MTAHPTTKHGGTILTPEAARILTDEIKADAAALWVKLLRLYEEGAHAALGYSSWEAYCEAEFDMRSSQAYRLLDSGRVIAALNGSPIGERPASESVARELVPVLRDEPERVEEVWAGVVQKHGPRPSAKQTRDVVKAQPKTRKPRRTDLPKAADAAARGLKQDLWRIEALLEDDRFPTYKHEVAPSYTATSSTAPC